MLSITSRREKHSWLIILLCLMFLVTMLVPGQKVFSQPENGPILVIVPDTATIDIGETQQYRAFVSQDGGETLGEELTELCTWSVDDPAIGEPTATKGLYRGVAPGATTVRATYLVGTFAAAQYRIQGEAELVVQEPLDLRMVWLEVDPETAVIYIGETQQYRAYLKSSDDVLNEDVTDESTWTLGDPTIASATATQGEFRGDAAGITGITATYVHDPSGEGSGITLTANARLTVREDEEPPETEDLPEGEIINRQPGYLTLSEPQDLGNPGAEFNISYDAGKMDAHPDRYPRVFYYNETYKKWVALASYPVSPGVVSAVNDGDYAGWFVVFGCIQPRFTDITPMQQWAEPIANRMNGLGLLEGYLVQEDPASLVRPAGLERTITRAELTTMVARILGLAPGETHLYPTLTYLSEAQANAVLQANYSDADQVIAHWAKPYIAAMTEAGLVRPKGDRFAPQDQMTRIEAAVLISDALRDVPGFGDPADLTVFTDYDEIPAWAVGEVAEGTVSGYPDGTLRPNNPINRAEAMTLLLRLLRGFGW